MRELSADELDEISWKHLSSLPYFRGMLRAVEHSLYARFDIPGPILDVGAGDGHFAEAYLTGQQSLGVDPWWQPLQEASSRKVYTLLVQADGSALPLPPASFAYAISNSVLEHIPNLQLVLNDIGRVMAPGGMFYFAVPNQHFRTDLWGMQVLNVLGLHSLATRYERFFNRIARHVNLDPPEVWLARLKLAGYSSVEYWNYFPKWALQMLERGHAAGLPNLLWKKTLGKWVLFPSRQNPFLHYHKIRRLLGDPLCEDGTCTFYAARRDA